MQDRINTVKIIRASMLICCQLYFCLGTSHNTCKIFLRLGTRQFFYNCPHMINRQDSKGPPESLSPASEAPWEPTTVTSRQWKSTIKPTNLTSPLSPNPAVPGTPYSVRNFFSSQHTRGQSTSIYSSIITQNSSAPFPDVYPCLCAEVKAALSFSLQCQVLFSLKKEYWSMVGYV